MGGGRTARLGLRDRSEPSSRAQPGRGGGFEGGGALSSILIFCKDCGKQVPSSQTRDQVCIDCRVRRSVADLRDEHARLWRKRERYQSRQANVEQIGHQIARVEDRMGLRIKELVSNERQAADYLRRELEAARGQRYTIKGV